MYLIDPRISSVPHDSRPFIRAWFLCVFFYACLLVRNSGLYFNWFLFYKLFFWSVFTHRVN